LKILISWLFKCNINYHDRKAKETNGRETSRLALSFYGNLIPHLVIAV